MEILYSIGWRDISIDVRAFEINTVKWEIVYRKTATFSLKITFIDINQEIFNLSLNFF